MCFPMLLNDTPLDHSHMNNSRSAGSVSLYEQRLICKCCVNLGGETNLILCIHGACFVEFYAELDNKLINHTLKYNNSQAQSEIHIEMISLTDDKDHISP